MGADAGRGGLVSGRGSGRIPSLAHSVFINYSIQVNLVHDKHGLMRAIYVLGQTY